MYTLADTSFKLALTGCRHLIGAASLATALTSLAFVATEIGADEPAVEAADGTSCMASFDPSARYPLMPEAEGADVSGEAGVVVHLQHHRGVVELGDCLYQLDRPLEIDFEAHDVVSILVEIHDDVTTSSELFVTSAGTVETHTVDGTFAVFDMSEESAELGFEIAATGQAAPTVPVVIAKPVDEGPPPK